MRNRLAVITVILMLACAARAASTAARLLPVDEARKDESFAAFREQLISALIRHDRVFVRAMLDANVKVSFGPENGATEFERQWKLDDPQSAFWETLLRVLKMGATKHGDGFVAPYVFSKWPQEYDPFEHAAVIERDLPLLSEPRDGSAVVTRLSYDIVRVTGYGESEWVKVGTVDGKTGFVPAAAVYSPVDYRAFFEQRDGQWRMTMFLAGD